MFAQYLTLLPEFILLSSLPVMLLVHRYRAEQTPKTFYTLSKVYLILALLFTLIFYNKSGFPHLWVNNPYTTLFRVVIYLLALTWFFLSLKWFLSKNRDSMGFYTLGMLAVIMLLQLISAQNLLIVWGALVVLCICNFFMIRLWREEEDNHSAANRYMAAAVFFMLLYALGMWILYRAAGTLEYPQLLNFLNQAGKILLLYKLAMMLIVAALLFMIALAPFHFWFVDVIRVSILPVCGFLTLVPVFAYLGCLVDITVNVFRPLNTLLRPAIVVFAVLSMLLGAVSANNENNIRRRFAFSTLYNLGFAFAALAAFNHNSILSAFVYIMVYILSMTGIYTVFYGFKSNGEYLTSLNEISGISKTKPYISAGFLVCMLSLTGIPPMLGFLGQLAVVNNLVIEHQYMIIGFMMFSLLLIAHAYLQVTDVMYFDNPVLKFDRTDKGIYICLFINIVIVLVAILNPRYLMNDIESMLSSIF